MSGREILLMGEQPPECGQCGARLEVDFDNPVDADRDGPIYRATCPVHGEVHVQDDPAENQADEDEAQGEAV